MPTSTTFSAIGQIFNQISTVQGIWSLVWPVLVTVFIFGGWLLFFHKKERRIFRNLKRKVYFLKIPGSNCDLEKERKLIAENGLFKADGSVRVYSNGFINTINEKAVIIISYTASFGNYADLINSLKINNVPAIVFAKPSEISPEHNNLFADYPYLQVCNFTSRLLTSLFDICAVTPLK